MIPIEALRKWHESVHIVLQREFPGLRIRNENKLNAAAMRWEFSTTIFPPNTQPKYVAGYFTLKELEEDQETIIDALRRYPHHLKRAIKETLDVQTDLPDRKPT